jgi:hypothetical protein
MYLMLGALFLGLALLASWLGHRDPRPQEPRQGAPRFLSLSRGISLAVALVVLVALAVWLPGSEAKAYFLGIIGIVVIFVLLSTYLRRRPGRQDGSHADGSR